MKIIFHCGSSKNGSTALQNFLSTNYHILLHQGTQVLLCSYPEAIPVSSEYNFCLERLRFYSGPMFSLKFDGHATASFGIPYEIYKKLLSKRDVHGLRKLVSQLSQAIEDSERNNANTVIISAEAFETSLCLKDPLFKKMILDFSKKHEVEVIYYAPNLAKHVLSAWLQWGWIEKIHYHDWILFNLKKTNLSKLVSSGGAYFCNLYDEQDWFGYWKANRRFLFRVITNQQDVIKHFFEKVHFVDITAPGFKSDLTSTERNMGWPKSLVVTYPMFFDFIAGDYVRFQVLRQLLIDKESESIVDVDDYDELIKLTQSIFFEHKKCCSDGFDYNSDRIKSALIELQNIFNNFNQSSYRRAIGHLCDAFYYYHLTLTKA